MKTTNDNCEAILASLHLHSLSEDEALQIISDITETEIREAIKQLKNNKSPGIDGLPGEYYKCFIDDLVQILTKVFKYALSKNDPPTTWSEAIISVIHKEGKNLTFCEGYRPISLLCNDQKLLTNILAKRMQKIISELINPDQTGFNPRQTRS